MVDVSKLVPSEHFRVHKDDVLIDPVYDFGACQYKAIHIPSKLWVVTPFEKESIQKLHEKVYDKYLDDFFAIEPKDLIIDTFRPAQAHWMDTARTAGVKITHGPTGLSVTETEERSQHKNKAKALKKINAIVKEHYMRTLVKEPLKAFATKTALEIRDDSGVEKEPTLADQKHGAVFKRHGAVCMTVRLCHANQEEKDKMERGGVSIINLQTGSVWVAEGTDLVVPVTAALTVKEIVNG